MVQRNLFDFDIDICAGRHRGNAQSLAADQRIRPHKQNLRQRVLAYIRAENSRGATVEEISLALGLRYTTASARCSELRKAALVFDSGRRRPTSTGSAAAVLMA